jgi:hypothetical protein
LSGPQQIGPQVLPPTHLSRDEGLAGVTSLLHLNAYFSNKYSDLKISLN